MHDLIHIRDCCRLCGSTSLELAMAMQASPIGDAYVTESELTKVQPLYPLDLSLCQNCKHLQLTTVINPNILFGKYIYRTKTSPGLVNHFQKYAEELVERFKFSKKSLAVEIGSNDGTLLECFKQSGMRVLGIDPALDISIEATKNGIETLADFFTESLAKQIKITFGSAELMVANNVFAHADDMDDILRGIKYLLDKDGVFVFEVTYLVDMFEKKVFDIIYHEHLCYHRIGPLEKFFNKHDMCLFDVKRIPTKGGSIRGFVKHKESNRPISPSVQELIQLEKENSLDSLSTYHNFIKNLSETKQKLKHVLQELKSQGKVIYGYGAAPAITTLIYHFDLGEFLDCIVDDNQIKQGRFSPGHHIPVVSSDAIYTKKPDYVLILAWQYADMIIKKHPKFLELGGGFIVPLPEVIVKHL